MKRYFLFIFLLIFSISGIAAGFDDYDIFMSAPSSSFYGYDIDQSLRFNDDDSAYLSYTPGGVGDTKEWVWFTWFKAGNLGVDVDYFSAGTDALTSWDGVTYNILYFFLNGGADAALITDSVFRDPGSWYQVVVSVNTKAGVAESDRIMIFINGTRITSFSTETYPAQDTQTDINTAVAHNLARNVDTTDYFDGYYAQTGFIDGHSINDGGMAITDLGSSQNGVWTPKDVSGLTFGTNGFLLDFADSGDIGNDVSGNGNDFTPTNLAATDVVTDSPTNNWCIWNFTQPSAVDLQNGNLYADCNDTDDSALATFGLSSGKWYWEIYTTVYGIGAELGIAGEHFNPDSWLYRSLANAGDVSYFLEGNGHKYQNDSDDGAYGGAIAQGHTIMFAYDADNGNLYIGYDGNWADGAGNWSEAWGDAVAAYSSISGTFYPAVSSGNEDAEFHANFGQDSTNVTTGNTDENGYGDFEYAPPTGFLALCSANLSAQPTFTTYASCATEDEDGEVTYTGNGNADGPFVFLGGSPEEICIDGTNYSRGNGDFDFNANGIKLRSAGTKNTNTTSYTLEYWLETEYENDFKYSNARGN